MLLHCPKCKGKTATRAIRAGTTKSGGAYYSGLCVDCGTKKARMGTLPAGVESAAD